MHRRTVFTDLQCLPGEDDGKSADHARDRCPKVGSQHSSSVSSLLLFLNRCPDKAKGMSGVSELVRKEALTNVPKDNKATQNDKDKDEGLKRVGSFWPSTWTSNRGTLFL